MSRALVVCAALVGLLAASCVSREQCVANAKEAYWETLRGCEADGVATYGECDSKTNLEAEFKAAQKECR